MILMVLYGDQEINMQLVELETLLTRHGIRGLKNTKGIETLWNEIQTGESTLVQDGFHLYRKTRVVQLHITANDHRLIHHGKKDLSSGKIYRTRSQRPLSEKMLLSETPIETALRGAKEEFGSYLTALNLVMDPDQDIQVLQEWSGPFGAYGTLQTLYELHQVYAKCTPPNFDLFVTQELPKWEHTWVWNK